MAYSCPSANVGSDHVDPTVPKLVTDSPPGRAIKVPIYRVTFATKAADLLDFRHKKKTP
jgi:hypothetical protein